MAAPPEEPLTQNGAPETEPAPKPHREGPATAVADPNVAARSAAETVPSAHEERKVPGHGEPKSESDRIRSEGAAQEVSASHQEVGLELQNGESAPTQNDGPSQPELGKDGGTFTMREVLNGLISDESRGSCEAPVPNLDSADSQETSQHNQIFKDSATADLISNITSTDEQGRPQHRILAFSAKRFASAIERNPRDYDALYNWALILQESADSVDPNSTSPSKDALLEEACKRYEEAIRLCPTLYDGYYNWAIAISDRARMHGRTKKGEEMWRQATKHYEKAVQLNWNSPQALNNWGLALQELSTIVPAKAKLNIVKTAISKFRAAIKLQFDFHRAIYNLGTVLYGLAEDTQRSGSGNATEAADDLFRQCSIYIAAAHALKPDNTVYKSAMRLVRSMLPLPNLKVGFFTAPPAGKPLSPHSEWERTPFVLNHEGLFQVIPEAEDSIMNMRSLSNKSYDEAHGKTPSIKVEIPDVVSVSVSADLALPHGPGLCIDTVHDSVYLVADSWECLDGWVDALRLVYTVFAKGKIDVLAGIITA